MLKILTLNGSPVKGSSTEILLRQIVSGIREMSPEPVRNKFVNLNNLDFIPCQACGISPEPYYCLFDDEIYPIYKYLIDCDIVLFGSPVYFDSVSAQAKSFIDRCNCLRPPLFDDETEDRFAKIIPRKRLGAILLVGGQRGQFECARKVVAGFFKWVWIENCGVINYRSTHWKEIGPAAKDIAAMDRARSLGRDIISRLS